MSARAERQDDGVRLTFEQIQHKLDNGGWEPNVDQVVRDLIGIVEATAQLARDVLEEAEKAVAVARKAQNG
jgi:hypothetical protein